MDITGLLKSREGSLEKIKQASVWKVILFFQTLVARKLILWELERKILPNPRKLGKLSLDEIEMLFNLAWEAKNFGVCLSLVDEVVDKRPNVNDNTLALFVMRGADIDWYLGHKKQAWLAYRRIGDTIEKLSPALQTKYYEDFAKMAKDKGHRRTSQIFKEIAKGLKEQLQTTR